MAQKNIKKILLVFIVSFLVVFAFKYAFADVPEFTQEDYNKVLQDFYDKASSLVQQQATNIDIDISPNYPKPHEEFTARLASYSFNTTKAYITWVVNGQTVSQGQGKNSITLKTGDAGTTVYISVSVTTESDLNLNKNKTIKIGDLDILWQANTYTPPFYNGKAMPTERSPITVVAVPQGFGSTNNLIFSWKRNFKNLVGSSGRGQNSITFNFTDVSSIEDIGVKISTTDGDNLIEKTISIRKTQPEIILYEESSLEGVLHQKALSTSKKIELSKSEIVVRAEPYYFLKSDVDSLSYTWTMNREQINPLSKPNTIGLEVPTSSTEGDRSSTITVQIKNAAKYAQQFTKNLQFSF